MFGKARKRWVEETNDKGKASDKEKEKDDQAGKALNMKQALLSKSSKALSSDWFLNSAAGRHMTGRKDWINGFRTMLPSNAMETATGQTVRAEGIGSVQLHTMVEGKLEEIKLTNVYYYPGLDSNLISLGQLDRTGVNFDIERDVISASKGGVIYFKVC